ncbi:MAG TPA: helix-turn-helix domain-containing protein [Burkholderiaceae bacterium]|nr:helix-turn-helix domain-containing protein [Burkholderiaceae bacterium]
MHILLLDAGTALNQLRANLTEAGHTVEVAPDVAAARAALAHAAVDVVAGDIHLLDADCVPVSQDANNGSPPPNSLRAQMRRFEAQVIVRALEETDGDRRLAAQRLSIGLSSLYRKIEELDIRERVRAAH